MPKIQASVPAASAVQSPVVVARAPDAAAEYLPVVDRVAALLAGASSLLNEGSDACSIDLVSALEIVEMARRELSDLSAKAIEVGAPDTEAEYRPSLARVAALLACVSSLLAEGFDVIDVDWANSLALVERALRELLDLREKAIDERRRGRLRSVADTGGTAS